MLASESKGNKRSAFFLSIQIYKATIRMSVRGPKDMTRLWHILSCEEIILTPVLAI